MSGVKDVKELQLRMNLLYTELTIVGCAIPDSRRILMLR